MTNLGSVLKRRDIILSTKVHLIKVMVFPGVMYGCESWSVKKAEHQRIDAFELWCWRRLESPLDCKAHGDWPFLRPPDHVPEVPIVSREHLPQLEKIQEVLPSRRDEAHFR